MVRSGSGWCEIAPADPGQQGARAPRPRGRSGGPVDGRRGPGPARGHRSARPACRSFGPQVARWSGWRPRPTTRSGAARTTAAWASCRRTASTQLRVRQVRADVQHVEAQAARGTAEGEHAELVVAPRRQPDDHPRPGGLARAGLVHRGHPTQHGVAGQVLRRLRPRRPRDQAEPSSATVGISQASTTTSKVLRPKPSSRISASRSASIRPAASTNARGESGPVGRTEINSTAAAFGRSRRWLVRGRAFVGLRTALGPEPYDVRVWSGSG